MGGLHLCFGRSYVHCCCCVVAPESLRNELVSDYCVPMSTFHSVDAAAGPLALESVVAHHDPTTPARCTGYHVDGSAVWCGTDRDEVVGETDITAGERHGKCGDIQRKAEII